MQDIYDYNRNISSSLYNMIESGNKYAITNNINKFDKNNIIKHHHEACETILKSIIFVLKDEYINMSFTEFIKIIYKTYFTINIDDINISLQHLSFYCYLDKPKKFENKIILNLPFSYLMKIYYSNNEIIYKLNNLYDNKYFDSIYLLNDCILNNEEMRKERYLCKDIIYFPIQRIYSQYETLSNGLKIRQHFGLDNYIIKGFFFECNIENLTNLQISITQQPIISYDKLLLKIYGHKISDNLIYISLNNKNDYNVCDEDSFSCAINCKKKNHIIDILMSFSYEQEKDSQIGYHFLLGDTLSIKDKIVKISKIDRYSYI